MDAGGTLPDIYVAGEKQTKRLIKSDSAKKVYIAVDANQKIISSFSSLCDDHNIEVDTSLTMTQIAKMCGVEMECTVCATLN